MKKLIFSNLGKLLTLAIMLMAMQVQAASRTVNFSDIMVEPGGTAKMVVSYETDYTDLTGFQVDFVLPDGITLTDAQAGSSLSQACPNLYFSFNPKRDDGETVIMCYNLSGTLPSGKKEAFVLTFRADKRAEKRTYGIKTTLIEFSHKGSSVADRLESQTFFVTVKKPFLSTMRGDVNNDRGISLTDVLMMVDYILDNPSEDFLTSNADFNGDGDISIADILMLVNIILGNPDGISFKWYLIANSADGQSQPIALDEIGSLAAAGSAYDFAILDNSGNTILENVTRVEFKYEYELEASGYTVPSGMPAAYLFRPMQARLYAASEQGGNRFLVADRNGNNLFARGVTFQHGVDGTTWTAGGSEGEIDDLQFISRANTQMVTGSGDDIIQMLEELSGTDNADAGAMATVADMNADVEEASAEDGANVVLKMKGSDTHVIYPLYDETSIFSEDAMLEAYSNALKSARKGRHTTTVYRGKVAIFNHFQGMEKYSVQNRMVSYIKVMFETNGYDVEYYGKYADPAHLGNVDYDQKFDSYNLSEVVRHSNDYKAILIFSHGFEFAGKSYFATSEVVEDDPNAEFVIHYNLDKEGDKYYEAWPVEGLDTDSKCITYLGSCFGVPNGGYGSNSFLSKKGTCFLAWKGKNRMAQADAMVLFHNMLYYECSLDAACGLIKDPWNPSSERLTYNAKGHSLEGEESLKPNYVAGKMLTLERTKDFYLKKEGEYLWELELKTVGPWKGLSQVKVTLEPYMNPSSDLDYEEFNGWVSSGSNVAHLSFSESLEENIYSVSVYTLENDKWQPVRSNPSSFIYSSNLSDNYASPNFDEADLKAPFVCDNSGIPVSEITLPAGTSQTYKLDAYPGHTFDTLCLDTDVATVSLSDTTLMVTGVSEGLTYFGVCDKENHKLAVVKVTVTDGSEPVSYLSCPDDHHPHMIDLGLPSGTLWACCNVDTEHPENQSPTNYGGYYAWGETEVKGSYDDSTYEYYQNGNFVDIGSDIAGTQYDVAHVKWGGYWVMPSNDQMEELLRYCTKEWTTLDEINVMKFTANNGGTIFMPAAGYFIDNSLIGSGGNGYYRSSTIEYYYDSPDGLYFYPSRTQTFCYRRTYGPSVRPVSLATYNVPLTYSLNKVELTPGQSFNVEIISGSKSYSIESVIPSDIVTAELHANSIVINALKTGTSTIIVKDKKSGQTATIEVIVTQSNGLCPDNNHPHAIDLGLPSGTKWACCNVDASYPSDYGGYYAWGETEVKDYYDVSNYKYYQNEKYLDIGNDIAGTQYDVAHVKWGGSWMMPSSSQIEELVNNCTYDWKQINGINGLSFIGNNGSKIFLPITGYWWLDKPSNYENDAFYWSSTQSSSEPDNSYIFFFYTDFIGLSNGIRRDFGHSVRPVSK